MTVTRFTIRVLTWPTSPTIGAARRSDGTCPNPSTTPTIGKSAESRSRSSRSALARAVQSSRRARRSRSLGRSCDWQRESSPMTSTIESLT